MLSPTLELLAVSIGLSLLLSIFYRVLTKPHVTRQMKKDVKEYRDKMNAAKKTGNMEEMNRHLKGMTEVNMKMLSHNMRPMLVSLVVFGLTIGWLSTRYADLVVGLPFTIPLLGWSTLNWYAWYIVIVIPFTSLFRKLLGAE